MDYDVKEAGVPTFAIYSPLNSDVLSTVYINWVAFYKNGLYSSPFRLYNGGGGGIATYWIFQRFFLVLQL